MNRDHNNNIYNHSFCHYREGITEITKLHSLNYNSLQKGLPAKSEVLWARWEKLDPCLRRNSRPKNLMLHLNTELQTQAKPKNLGRSHFGNPSIHQSESFQKKKCRSETNQTREKEKLEEEEYLCELKWRTAHAKKIKVLITQNWKKMKVELHSAPCGDIEKNERELNLETLPKMVFSIRKADPSWTGPTILLLLLLLFFGSFESTFIQNFIK